MMRAMCAGFTGVGACLVLRKLRWRSFVEHLELSCRVTTQDLGATNTSRARIAAEQARLAIVLSVIPLITGCLLVVGGTSVSPLLLLIMSTTLFVVGLVIPVHNTRDRANSARREFRHSLSAYLDMVSILVSGGAGIETALAASSRVGGGPTFDAIAKALDIARTERRSPWDLLASEGERIGVGELPELAATIRLGGEQGARVAASLVAKAEALREKQLAEVEARANSATERMGLPMVMLFIGFLILLGFPAMQMIGQGFS